MAKLLIKRKKSFPVKKDNPYRTRDIKIEGKLVKRNKIEIKAHQVDWTLKTKVAEKVASYTIDSEYDYVSLVKMLYRELVEVNSLAQIVEQWLESNKFKYSVTNE